mgnify:CR=1 FL=1
MHALSKLKSEPGIWPVEAPVPTPGPNDLLIKVRKSSICGTDVHIYRWDDWAQKTIPVPMIVGHEYVGTVVGMGSEVRGFTIGDRVSGEGHVTCGHCRNCRAGRRHLCRNTQGIGVNRQGSFAEYLVLPAFNAFKLPDDVPDDIAAIFDPFGNAVHTALSFDLVGEDVLITGAGPIGVMAAAIARHAGARHIVVTDLSDTRLALARAAGADLVVNSGRQRIREAQAELGMREGFDIALEMSGAPPAVAELIDNMNHGGRVALLGLPHQPYVVDWPKVITHMLTIRGIYGREMYESWYAMSAMLQTSPRLEQAVASVITHRIPASDWAQAFEVAKSGQCGKVVMNWEE